MSRAAELRLQRRNTVEFISWNPKKIALTPQEHVRTNTGGYQIQKGTPRAEQTFRLIDVSSATMPNLPTQRTVDGEERSVQYFLLGVWDCEMSEGDFWTEDRTHWEITHVFPDVNQYERRAVVVHYAKQQ